MLVFAFPACSSPHVSQRCVFSGGVEVPVQPELAQLESQRGESVIFGMGACS